MLIFIRPSVTERFMTVSVFQAIIIGELWLKYFVPLKSLVLRWHLQATLTIYLLKREILTLLEVRV